MLGLWWARLLNFLAAVSGNGAGGGGSFESIATATGTGSSGTITFSSIPSTYQHLQVRFLVRSTSVSAGFENLLIRFNSDTGSNYDYHVLFGDGSSASASAGTSATSARARDVVARSGVASNIHGVGVINLNDYASTTKNKTISIFHGVDANGSGNATLQSGLWRNTNAVNSITLFLPSDSWTTSSTFALYGIKGA